MLRKGYALIALATLALLPAMSFAQAGPRGPWELTFGASGANGSRFNGITAAGNASLGYYLPGDVLELAVRQSVTFSDLGPASLNASTAAAADIHFPLGDQGQFVPFVGANIGFVYGQTVRDTWEAAPEAGIKWYVNSTTFLYGLAEYQFFFTRGGNVSSGFKDGQFVYTGGIGFRF